MEPQDNQDALITCLTIFIFVMALVMYILAHAPHVLENADERRKEAL